MREVLGKIIKPQGVKGELKVYPADTDMSIYKNVKKVYIDDQQITLTSCCIRQQFLYIKFPSCNDRNIAEKYRNKKVYVDSNELSLKENTYFTKDLLNRDVVDQNGEFIGTLVDIESYGSADVFTILEDKREYKIPFLTSIVISVGGKNIVVDKVKYDEVKICE